MMRKTVKSSDNVGSVKSGMMLDNNRDRDTNGHEDNGHGNNYNNNNSNLKKEEGVKHLSGK